MPKWIKRTLLVIVVLLVVMISGLLITASFFGDDIAKRLLTVLDKQISTKFEASDPKLDLISKFPNASLALSDVVLEDTRDKTLLEAKEVSFQFNILSLFRKKINLQKLQISDGALLVHIDRKGNANYDIIQKQTGESIDTTVSEKSSLSLDIQEANLVNIETIYQDLTQGLELNTVIDALELSGSTSKKGSKVVLTANSIIELLDYNKERYLTGQKVELKGSMDYDAESATWNFNKTNLVIDKNQFILRGKVKESKNGQELDLRGEGEKVDLGFILGLFPQTQSEFFEELDSKGKLDAVVLLKGKSDKKNKPKLSAEINFDKGQLSHPKLAGGMKDVSFDGAIDLTPGKEKIDISNLVGFIAQERISGSINMQGISNPLINLDLSGRLPTKTIAGFLDNEKIGDSNGDIEFEKIKLKGYLNDILDPRRSSRIILNGSVGFDDTSIEMNDEKIFIDRGKVNLKNNAFDISALKIEAPGSDVTISGTIKNVLPVLFSDSLNSKNARLGFDLDLSSKVIDVSELNKLSALFEQKEKAKGAKKDSLISAITKQRQITTSFLEGNIKVDVQRLVYDKLEIDDLTGDLEMSKQVVRLLNGKMKTLNGELQLNAKADLRGDPILNGILICSNIQTDELFESFDDFDQAEITSKNINGKVDAKVDFETRWDGTGVFQKDKIKADADICISKGELQNVKMMERFEKFIKIKDLRQIRFTNLSNTIKIRNKVIHIPAMYIQSNALNLTLSGKHAFDNRFDYMMKVNAGQVVSEGFKKHDELLRPKKAKRKGWFNIYSQIKGSIDDYEMVKDKRRIKHFLDAEIASAEKRNASKSNLCIKLEPDDWEDAIAPPEYDPIDTSIDDDDFLEGFDD